MTRWDYSAALLLQVATWTTLQFWRLRVAVTIASLFLERALHSTLPFDAAPRRDGGNRAGVPKNTAEAGVGGVWTLRPWWHRMSLPSTWCDWSGRCCHGLAPGGGRPGAIPRGRGRGTMAREATMVAARTDGGGSGGGANYSRGNGLALSPVPLLASTTTSWPRGGQ
jgi:hypothetical protein